MRVGALVCLFATTVASSSKSADEILFVSERERLPVALAWCSGALEVRAPAEANLSAAPELHLLLRASSFPEVEVTRLKVGVSPAWNPVAGHLLVVTAHGPDGPRVLHAGTPREVGPGYVAVQLVRPPPLRGDSVRVTLQVRGGAGLAVSLGPLGAGKVDDGGLVIVAAACGGENASVACAPASLEVRYDAECAGAGRRHVLVDALRLSRVEPSQAAITTDRLVAALRGAYGLAPGDDVLVKSQTFQRWLGVSRAHGALRVEYVLRTAEPRQPLSAAELAALARSLAIATVSRRAPSPAATLARAACAVGLLAAGGACVARLAAGRGGAAGAENNNNHREPKAAVDVVGMKGVYPKNLVL